MIDISSGRTTVGKPDKMFEFKSIRLRVQGMMATAREYEALKTKEGVEVSLYDGPWTYDEKMTREDCLQSRKNGDDKFYCEMGEFFYEIGLEKWDGFNKSNPDVLDGYTFTFEAETVDGKKMHAYGSNSYPENYRKFEDYLWNIIH